MSKKTAQRRHRQRCQGCLRDSREDEVLFVQWKHPTHEGCTTGAFLCAGCRQTELHLEHVQRTVDERRVRVGPPVPARPTPTPYVTVGELRAKGMRYTGTRVEEYNPRGVVTDDDDEPGAA